MYPMIFPAEPTLQVFINTQRIGLLQAYEVRSSFELTPICARGNSKPLTLLTTGQQFCVTLKRLVLDYDNIPPQPNPYALTNFQLVIEDKRQRLQFSGCHWTELLESYALGQTVAEELRLTANACIRTALL